MRAHGVALLSSILALAWTGIQTEPGGETRSGSELFFTHCAACHGTAGEGDGPLADALDFAPPDLTRFALRNDGQFDEVKVYQIVDGRDPLPGHGGPEMPIWGDAFKSRENGYSEAAVEQRIRLIVRHLATIQRLEDGSARLSKGGEPR